MKRMTEPARPARSVVASALFVAAGTGVAVGLGLAVALAADNGFGVGRDTAVLCAWLVGLYGALHAIGLGALAGALLLAGRRPGARVFLAAAVGFYVLLNGLL